MWERNPYRSKAAPISAASSASQSVKMRSSFISGDQALIQRGDAAPEPRSVAMSSRRDGGKTVLTSGSTGECTTRYSAIDRSSKRQVGTRMTRLRPRGDSRDRPGADDGGDERTTADLQIPGLRRSSPPRRQTVRRQWRAHARSAERL